MPPHPDIISRQEQTSWRIIAANSMAALLATAVLLPAVMALATVLLALLCPYLHPYTPLWGAGIAVLLWLGTAVGCRNYTTAAHAIPSSFHELQERLSRLQAVLPSTVGQEKVSLYVAYTEAKTQQTCILEELQGHGPQWVLAVGYSHLWKRLLRAEEALIEVLPVETVIAEALYDELRLEGSKIEHSKALLHQLRQAIMALDASAYAYFSEAALAAAPPLVITSPTTLHDSFVGTLWTDTLGVAGGVPPYQWTPSASSLPEWLTLSATGVLSGTPQTARRERFTVRVTDSASTTATRDFTLTVQATATPPATSSQMTDTTVPLPEPMSDSSATKRLARALLRTVRRAVNEFRDERWNALIVARNRLAGTMIFTGLTAYVLLAIALINLPPSREAITAVAVFYLVGAITGLLSRLYSESQQEAAVKDYGLSAMRLLSTPLLSGLVAVAGVALVVMLPLATSIIMPAPANGSASPDQLVVLTDIFDLTKNRAGLFVAAMFGLTPGLLFNRLQQQAEKYKADLKTSSATSTQSNTAL